MPDRNGDGVADDTKVFADRLSKPHGWPSIRAISMSRPRRRSALPLHAWATAGAGEGEKIADLPFGDEPGAGQGREPRHPLDHLRPGQQDVYQHGLGLRRCARKATRGARLSCSSTTTARAGESTRAGCATRSAWTSTRARACCGPRSTSATVAATIFPPDLLTPIRSNGDYGWPYCLGIPLAARPAVRQARRLLQGEGERSRGPAGAHGPAWHPLL